MANQGAKNTTGMVPAGWIGCPRKGVDVIYERFLAFKTPLDSRVPEEHQFSVDMLFGSLKSQNAKMGLWIDLSNTTKYYNKSHVEAHGCNYFKLQCAGHGETPSVEQTKEFIEICNNFIAQNPQDLIGVHCTHGFNTTGFLLISFLVENQIYHLDDAISEFSFARPPGIYKEDYIRELYRRYDVEDDAPPPPPRPDWHSENDEASGNRKFARREQNNNCESYSVANPSFMVDIPGVKPLQDPAKIAKIQKKVQEACHRVRSGFPGSKPTAMDMSNIALLNLKLYRVSWKSDSVRYMMLIQENKEVFFIDKNNCVFQISGLTFPHPTDLSTTLKDTILDGEMVIDRVNGREYPRFLAFDIIMFDGEDVSDQSFFPERYTIVETGIIGARHKALKEGRILREKEPFSVRHKQFWDVTQAANLLGKKFRSQLAHNPNGLIFQPTAENYTPGMSSQLLKWKPSSSGSTINKSNEPYSSMNCDDEVSSGIVD